MFRFTRKSSSWSRNQYLTKNTGLVQRRYKLSKDIVSAMAEYAAIALTTSVRRLYQY